MKQVLVIGFVFLSFCIQAKSNYAVVTDTTVVVNELIAYKINQDANTIYISVSTSDKKTMMTMLHRGVTVYFDVKGKKKKGIYVRYPKESVKPNFNDGQPKTENRPDLKEILDDMPKYALYKNLDNQSQFHIGLNALDIALSFSEIERETLQYELRIPKEKIDSNSKNDFSKLSIGVLIGTNDRKKGSKPGMSFGQGGKSGGGQGAPPGGGRGGGQGPPSGGGQRGAGTSSQSEPTSMTTKAFWIDVD